MKLFSILPIALCAGLTLGQDLCIENEQLLVASDQNNLALFGIHVDTDGQTVVVGASDNSSTIFNGGAVYVFTDTGDGWSEVAILESLDLDPSDFVGYSVAVDGDTIVAGAWGDDGVDSLAGAAYIFERDFGGLDNWGQRTKLIAPNGGPNDLLGFDVDVSGDMAVVSALLDNDAVLDQGSVYLYCKDSGTGDWDFVLQLLAPDPIADAQFGSGVAIDGDTLIVGAVGDNQVGAFGGAAYIFERNLGGQDAWGLRTKIVADTAGTNNQINDQFGFEVAIDQDRIVIGAINRDLGGVFAGAAYLFERDEGGVDNWGQVHEFIPVDAHSGQQFGNTVAISGGRVVVGALRSNSLVSDTGSAYVFAVDEFGVWTEQIQLAASNPEMGDLYGSSVAINGDQMVVGARIDTEAGIDGGSATVIQLSSDCDVPCLADLAEPFGVLNLQDVFAYLGLFNAQDPAADLAEPFEVLNLQDVFAYLASFNAGCP
ncbi:MAG: hypothetical protein JKY96_08580 [Phycisphaerales bacterium]|nr:hypothetical protein [Phycisphaerales bacterium]